MKSILLILLLMPGIAAADWTQDWSIGTINKSYHSSRTNNQGEPYNETHNGWCVEYTRIVTCSYNNSYEDRSYLLAWEEDSWAVMRVIKTDIHVGTTFGRVTGYDNVDVFASLDFHIGYVQVSFLPGELFDETNIVAVGLEISLDELSKLLRL